MHPVKVVVVVVVVVVMTCTVKKAVPLHDLEALGMRGGIAPTHS
jgi:hypothetical protein